MHRLPHADDALRGDGADRSLDASAHAGGHDRLQVAQRLQPVPRRPRRRLGRPVGPQVVSARLPGRAAPPGGAAGRGPEAAVETAAGNAGRSAEQAGATRSTATRSCGCSAAASDPKKWPVLIAALKDASPLVRASAAAALEGYFTDESARGLLVRATADPVRLVRIRAAAALAAVHPEQIDNADARQCAPRGRRPSSSRPWRPGPTIGPRIPTWAISTWKAATSTAAVAAFETALKLEPRVVGSHGQLVDGLHQLEAERQGRGLAPPGVEGRTGQRRGQLQPGTAPGRDRPPRRGRAGLAGRAEVRPATCPRGLQPGRDSRRKEGPGRGGPAGAARPTTCGPKS